MPGVMGGGRDGADPCGTLWPPSGYGFSPGLVVIPHCSGVPGGLVVIPHCSGVPGGGTVVPAVGTRWWYSGPGCEYTGVVCYPVEAG